MEGAGAGAGGALMTDTAATDAGALASGKSHAGENFPVASFIIKRPHRAVIMAFYRFARRADDIADHASAPDETKLDLLAAMEAGLAGAGEGDPVAAALAAELDARGLGIEHPLDLLAAFRQDVSKRRYADWRELMDYCRYSAAPVGRLVLDVHGESRETWPANDALCAALQVINHLQDCAEDYRALDRVYLPLDALASDGAAVEDLAGPAATPGLRRTIRNLAARTGALLDQARPLARQIRDGRLALEVAVIQRLAESLTRRLSRADPLSERVHHSKIETLVQVALGLKDRFIPRVAA